MPAHRKSLGKRDRRRSVRRCAPQISGCGWAARSAAGLQTFPLDGEIVCREIVAFLFAECS